MELKLDDIKSVELDLGYEEQATVPLTGRKSISILIGAGFSAPKGYPIGNQMNNWLLNFDDSKISFSPSGELAVSKNGKTPQFQINGVLNAHQKYFIFCKRLIKEYAEAHNNEFDYEVFYDFIKSEEAKEGRYQILCDDLCNEFENYERFLFNVSHIYNQMAEYLLKDKDGKRFYDNEPYKVGYVDGYNGFLQYLSKLCEKHIINVHTLNHDLLFESFNNTEYINGNISDGFDEYGSEYYGNLIQDNRTYHCRLERYTGRYNTPIRLFKLHGSLDYVPFYKTISNCTMIPERYVKIKWGMGAGDIIKGRKSKIGYDISPFEYHADFLTGTTSKIQRYNEPLLFRKLFKKFKRNLQNAEKLIIIGYGCKDKGINEMIMEYFDYANKPVFIIDKYAGNTVVEFGDSVNAKLYKIDINNIKEELFI